MKIEYIWFKEYKHLKDFEANFGSNYFFQFDRKNTINIFNNNSYIENFFNIENEPKNRLELTAIVGKNGVGKSTILDFISEYIKDLEIINDYIIIYSIEDQHFIRYQYNQTIVSKNYSNKDIVLTSKNFYSPTHMTIFFSNIFDVRYMGMGSEMDSIDYRNISTNALLGRHDSIEQFLNSEFEKQIFFLYEYRSELEVISLLKIPELIKIEIIDDLAEQIDLPDFIENGIIPLNKWENAAALLFNNGTKNPFVKNLLRMMAQVYFININNILYRYSSITDQELPEVDGIYRYYSPEKYEEFNSTGKDNNNILDFFIDNLIISIEKENILDEKNLKGITENLQELEKKFKKFYKIVNEIEFQEFKPTGREFSETKLENLKSQNAFLHTDNLKVEEFIESYTETFEQLQILSFSWTELSSGQYGLLSLFGRFHSTIKDIYKEVENPEEAIENSEQAIEYPTSYLLMIDEGDLYFHPQWQKDWLYYFLQLAISLFKADVQIILTTHSPLVLSDFPNSNVMFLEDELLFGSQLEGSPRTFGANINELFSNSFFIKDGLVGKFGKMKVNKFTKQLVTASANEIYANKDYYERFIDNIGEPLVRGKLIEIYKDKINLYTEKNIEERIKHLEQELLTLKNKR